ncbi:universal stress protein [Pontibacter sp. G13]|uniref:universal stress protein n=1 Tax=Pontibacter sp. G13 TaxID=3074898 RepID=UPI00288B402C|nr:universal stress protein [Pontibacter sp. G13]WNJ21298.1 universal stress protein [Pontibacter sp. G13]
MKNILVALDFNPSSQILTDKAAQIAARFNAKVWVVHVAAPDPAFIGYEAGPQFIREERATELKNEHSHLQSEKARLEALGIQAESLLVQGPTVETLIEEAEALQIDLFVIGHHQHGFLYRAWLGDTAEDLMRKTEIPLMVVPLPL